MGDPEFQIGEVDFAENNRPVVRHTERGVVILHDADFSPAKVTKIERRGDQWMYELHVPAHRVYVGEFNGPMVEHDVPERFVTRVPESSIRKVEITEFPDLSNQK
jgi:hypothetical protein